ncbi:MAG TPA: hypothetical protein VFM30_06625, partial [Steroidobacteraceae bacterium]|nr:hypothetical protein [Steroidobacteraceae bacterium]
ALSRGAVFRIATGAWAEADSMANEALLLDHNLGLDELVTLPLAEIAVVAALRGARIIRAHDVRETVDALAVVAATGGFGDNRA